VAAVFAAHAYLTSRRLLAYLRYFQQEGYEAIRFLKWARFRSLTDPALWVALSGWLLFPASPRLSVLMYVGAATVLGLFQPDPRKSGKIPLRLTWRATRVVATAGVLALALWLVMASFPPTRDGRGALLVSAVMLGVLPIVLIAANASLAGYERRVQRRYEADARRRIDEVRPFIIGITGSYGKSSAKAMLAHILQFEAPTLAASGSINTLMGVTRHIRDELVHGHKYMVVEMGAFKAGSIRRLCQLTPPSAGLITAVGDMHLERFGSTDEIVRAKSELASAVPPGGLLVVNAESAGALEIARGAKDRRVLLYGETTREALDTRLEQVAFTKSGTSFLLRTRDRMFACFTPLLGRPIILNLAGAFTMARAIGVDPEVIVAAMRTLKPVSNRLEVVEEAGVTWIRDAYNSNQFGFRAALEVAAALPVERRFLATPGVVELGPAQFEVNRALAREAAGVCDATVVVSATNRRAFEAGHHDAGRETNLVTVDSRAEAFQWLRQHVREGDAVILENDLPDLYERAAGVFWPERDRSERKVPAADAGSGPAGRNGSRGPAGPGEAAA
jgi:UDP-N-acetylmuramoyl-tripeptide--D-alanyl-D-alanine ligase